MDFSTHVPQRMAPSQDDLRKAFVGRHINDVPKPAAIVDLAVVRRNCATVDNAIDELGVGFRAHIKTHKTSELTAMQVASQAGDINLVASTLAEIDHLVPLMTSWISSGRKVNILYGIPLPPSQVPRLAHIAKKLGPGAISVMVDHPSQLDPLASTFFDITSFPAKVFIKVDTGYHRAGLPPSALNKGGLLDKIAHFETSSPPRVQFHGLYSHSSLSYNGNTPKDAMDALATEINGCIQSLSDCAAAFSALAGAIIPSTTPDGKDRELVISVGASPQIISVGNLQGTSLLSSTSPSTGSSVSDEDSKALRAAIAQVPAAGASSSSSSSSSGTPGSSASFKTTLELHAGVYAIRDIQQLATNAIAPGSSTSSSAAGHSDAELYGIDTPEQHVAFSVAAEVCSVYNDHERAQPEALIAVGTLGLGREPCKMYEGWGILAHDYYSPATSQGQTTAGRRIAITRISQEHGIATWMAPTSNSGEKKKEKHNDDRAASLPPLPLEVGQVVRVFPNHACITGAAYGWYLVVDSEAEGDRDVVRDVYVRASGW